MCKALFQNTRKTGPFESFGVSLFWTTKTMFFFAGCGWAAVSAACRKIEPGIGLSHSTQVYRNTFCSAERCVSVYRSDNNIDYFKMKRSKRLILKVFIIWKTCKASVQNIREITLIFLSLCSQWVLNDVEIFFLCRMRSSCCLCRVPEDRTGNSVFHTAHGYAGTHFAEWVVFRHIY